VLVNVAGNDVETEIGAGEQWSVGAGGDFDAFSGKVIWTQLEADDTDAEAQELLFGLGFGFDAWSVDGYYAQIISASGGGSLDEIDGLQSYGVGVTYDLGGGARVEGGVASVWDLGGADDGFMVADFGIGMAF
jgi:outer membrane protein OmpU